MTSAVSFGKGRKLEKNGPVVDTVDMASNLPAILSSGGLRVAPVAAGDLPAFLEYCATRGPEHDDSFLPGAGFSPDADHPSFLLFRDDRPAGAACLLLEPSFRAARRSRFAILHAERGDRRDYFALLASAAEAAASAADELFLFLPADLAVPAEYLAQAGFRVERLVYEMARDDLDFPAPGLPRGYRLEPLAPGDEETIRLYVETRNRNFREVLGSLPLGTESIRKDLESPDIPPGGLALLRSPDGSACGTMRAERDVEPDCLSVGALTVDREHRGRGLGRQLLHAAAALGRREGFRRISLSVNAKNENALGLYLSEGFAVRASLSCLSGGIQDILLRLAAEAGGP